MKNNTMNTKAVSKKRDLGSVCGQEEHLSAGKTYKTGTCLQIQGLWLLLLLITF